MHVPYPIEELFALADREGVRVGWYPTELSPRGCYLIVDGKPAILLSPVVRESPMRWRCALAHELGHHFTGLSGPLGGDLRDEARADRWARELLLPADWVLDHRHLTPGQMAEEAGVYQLWVEARLRDLARLRGACA